jgi:hypothetical protein
VLSELDRNRFYSSWHYSAIRLLCDIPEHRTPERIAERLDISLKRVNEALEFLISCGLVIEENGEMKMGLKRTFLEAPSPLSARNHTNWRLKSIERLEKLDLKRDLVLTAPMTLSRADALQIRKKIVEFIEETMKLDSDSKSEELHLLTIDWLKI